MNEKIKFYFKIFFFFKNYSSLYFNFNSKRFFVLLLILKVMSNVMILCQYKFSEKLIKSLSAVYKKLGTKNIEKILLLMHFRFPSEIILFCVFVEFFVSTKSTSVSFEATSDVFECYVVSREDFRFHELLKRLFAHILPNTKLNSLSLCSQHIWMFFQ